MSKKTVVVFTGHRADSTVHESTQAWIYAQFDGMFEKMEAAGCEIIRVLHGGARGSDTAFDGWLNQSKYKDLKEIHRPNYNAGVDPLVAPLIRNKLMVDRAYGEELGADRVVLIAIYDGRTGGGTAQTMRYYREKTEANNQQPKILSIKLDYITYTVMEWNKARREQAEREAPDFDPEP